MNSLRPFVPKLRKLTQFEVCFDDEGNLKNYSDSRYWGSKQPSKKEQNSVFHDELRYDGYFCQGSSSHIRFISLKTGRKYHMFMSDFDELVRADRFEAQVVEGLFCFTKRGQSQGCRVWFGDPP